MGLFGKKREVGGEAENSRAVRHIVCLCYDAPDINSLKPQMQDFIVGAERTRGSVITPASRITFDSFYDNSDLDKPEMIRQKLQQIYSSVYPQSAMYELADKSVAREVQQRDGHTLVRYYVLYEEGGAVKKAGPGPLAVPATIKIIRDSSMVATLAPTFISLNGVQVAMIANGGSAVIQVDSSPIVLQTNGYGSKYVRYELEVPSGAYGEVHVKANVFQPKLTVWR